jgi:GTP-binding protein Era
MLSRAQSALAEGDVILWVVDGLKRGPDHRVAQAMVHQEVQKKKPVIVAINKVDKLTKGGRALLAPLSHELDPGPTGKVIEISAKTGLGIYALKNELYHRLPPQNNLYPPETLTDQPLRTLAAEMIREAVFRLTSQEIPYATAVTVDEFKEPSDHRGYGINATIHVEKTNQKKMVIGQGGQMLKNIGQTARINLEKFLGEKVFLSLFVRVTKDWSKNIREIKEFGYGD